MNAKFVLPIIGAAVSLATLWFFRAFRKLLYPSDFRYFDLEVPTWFDYAAILTCVLILALVLFSIALAAEFSKNVQVRRIFSVLFFGLGIASFGSLSSEIITWLKPDADKFVNLPLPLLVLALCISLSYLDGFGLKPVVSRLRMLSLILLPFAGLLLIQTAMMWVKGGEPPLGSGEIERGVSAANRSEVKSRVLWIIFDELEMATMLAHPESVEMPAMDRLMAESVVAENVYPPDDYTLFSIPALLTGQLLESSKPYSAKDLKLIGLGRETAVAFSETENIVDDVRELGGHVAIAGWYHPYTRLLENKLAYGYFKQPYARDCFDYSECVRSDFLISLENVPGAYRLLAVIGLEVDRHKYAIPLQIARNKYLRERALEIVSNPRIDLAYLHFSIPHGPYLNKNDEPAESGYHESLEAVDRTLSEIRESLTAAGEWDKTTLIVSADHWWRFKTASDFGHVTEAERAEILADTRIPFIVKMPGQDARVDYAPAFNSVITRYMINAVMRGEIRTPGELTGWLDEIIRTKPEYANFRPEHK